MSITESFGGVTAYNKRCFEPHIPLVTHGAPPSRRRGFEVVTGYTPVLPIRKTKHSSAYDINIIKGAMIKPGETHIFKTGIKAYFPCNESLLIYIRSSVAIERNLVLSTGVSVIDSDYYNNPKNEGEIMIPITNIGNEAQNVSDGERICQAMFQSYYTIDNDSATGVRIGGSGSTNA